MHEQVHNNVLQVFKKALFILSVADRHIFHWDLRAEAGDGPDS